MRFTNVPAIPVSSEAVNYVGEVVERVLNTRSSLRKIVPVEATHETIVSLPDEKKSVKSKLSSAMNLYTMLPTVELKQQFEISRSELSALGSGLDQVDTTSLEKCITTLIVDEEKLIYSGDNKLNIKGVMEQLSSPAVVVAKDAQSIISGILKSAIALRNNYYKGPFVLVAGMDLLQQTALIVGDKVLAAMIEQEIGSDLIVSDTISGGLLLSKSCDDLVIKRGQDFEITYLTMKDDDSLVFEVTNSFTFQVVDERFAVPITVK